MKRTTRHISGSPLPGIANAVHHSGAIRAFCASLSMLFLASGSVTAATFVVDTTTDVALTACTAAAADCSLRGAIATANSAPDVDSIHFDIPAADTGCDAAGICRIALTSGLSVSQSLNIDGYTQAGAQANSIPAPGANNAALKIEITSAGFASLATPMFSVQSDRVFSVRGLALFAPGAALISGGLHHDHRGNWFCVDARGQSPEFTASCNALGLSGFTRSIRIGGPAAADRNVLAGGGRDASSPALAGGGSISLRTNSASGERAVLLLQGNLIGLAPDGLTALPLRDPVTISVGDDSFQTPDIQVLDNRLARATRLFGGNFRNMLAFSIPRVMTERALVQGNVFGLGVDGSVIGVEGDHITVSLGNSARVPILQIGGLAPGEGNVFAGAFVNTSTGSKGAAVVLPSGTVSTFVEFVGNSMLGNAGIGLDFPTATVGGGVAFGRTPNDVDDQDSGANQQQNSPQISAFQVNGSSFDVSYRVDSAPANSAYPLRVDFYKARGDEGEVLLDSDVYEAPAAQQTQSVTLNVPPGVSLSDDDVVLAVTTDALGRSSEFSFDTLNLSVDDSPDPHPAGLPFEVTVTAVATSGPFKPNGIVDVSMNTSPATTCQIVLAPSSAPLTSIGSCQMVPVVTGTNRTLTATYRSLQGAFASATGGDITATTTHTITDPGPEQIGFRSCRFSALEGSDAVIQIERPSGGVASVSVDLEHSTGTASIDVDYTAPANQVLQWAPGDLAAKTITVPIFSDALSESNEHFRLNLNNVIGAAILPFAQMDVQILDGSEARTFRDGFEGEGCLP